MKPCLNATFLTSPSPVPQCLSDPSPFSLKQRGPVHAKSVFQADARFTPPNLIVTDHTKGTALLAAAFNGREDITSLLLNYNCQLDTPGDVRIERINITFTPLQCAIHIGFTCVARLLVLAGAHLNDLTYLWTNEDVPESLVMECDFWSWLIEQATNVSPLVILCQRTIRKILGKPIHRKVELLPLPRSIKGFILLHNVLSPL